MSSAPPPIKKSARVGGRYVIEEALGRGGMAAVYRAHDEKTGKKLALKRAWARDTKKALKRRGLLEREFHTLAQLSHPRIIDVYDYGVDEDGPYYTMELLDGADLDKSGRIPWQEACALLRDLASSLAIVHSRGLVHRDVSARNVRRTADGRAKLIDFGAMVSAGHANDVVGTPPFMAPEVLQMQALDARADLFSLGALGYYLLTGRHAYAARRVSDLRDLWRSRPAAPSRVVPDVPAALSALLMELLALDRSARPRSAPEVMERLCAIANLPKEELPEISRAYLAMPALIGRERALHAIRSRILSLVRGDGGTVLVEGVAGSGRSRVLDACVLEGKVLGTTVARADARQGATVAWGVARALCAQLFDQMPDEASAATRLSRSVLGHVIDEVRLEQNTSTALGFPERSLLLRELRDFILALAGRQRLLIVVDDADRIDEPSAALLAALADKSERQSLLLVLAMETERTPNASASLHLLQSLAVPVGLEPLDAEQIEALMRSVFGDVAHLPLLAARVHALAMGNARTSIEIVQHVVDRGLARYEAGSWLLPARLDERDLPQSLTESLTRRLEALTADARELVEALAVADGYPLPLRSYRALTSHKDQKRVFSALEQLVAARVLVADPERYRFSQRGFLAVALAGMLDKRRKTLHAQFADVLATNGADAVQRAQHLLLGAREAEAIQVLCSVDLLARLPDLGLLERAAHYAETLANLPARAQQRLRMAVLVKAALVGAPDSFRRWLPAVMTIIERDSGLRLYRELSAVPAEARLAQALALQQQRHLSMPEHEQVANVGEAVRELARVIGAVCSMAATMFDLELLETLPSLEPLLPLSPALRVISHLQEATDHWIRGRSRLAAQCYERTLLRLAEPDRAGLDDSHHERMRLGLHYALALLEAAIGIDRVEERALILEQNRSQRINAWRVRMLVQLAQGNPEAAQKCARRAELLQLQDDDDAHYLGTNVWFELLACNLAGDLLGIKSAIDGIDLLARKHSGWRLPLLHGQSCYRALQGDHEGALALLNEAFLISQPGRDMVYGFLAAQQIRVLSLLGRTDEALARAKEHVAVIEREQVTTADRFVRLETAQALMHAGEYAEAIQMIDPVLAWLEARGSSGLALGVFYEARARISMAMGDSASFDTYANRCATEYRKGKNPVLNAKFQKLLDDAKHNAMTPDDTTLENAALLGVQATETEYNTVNSRMLECIDGPDRARCALTLLLQSTDSYLGYLYGCQGEALEVLAGLPERAAEPALEAWLRDWVASERWLAAQPASTRSETISDLPGAPSDMSSLRAPALSDPSSLRPRAPTDVENAESVTAPQTNSARPSNAPSDYFVDAQGHRFRAVLLMAERDGEKLLAAVLAIELQPGHVTRPSPGLLEEVANQLLLHHDVSGVGLPDQNATIEG